MAKANQTTANYAVVIAESSKELTAKDRIRLKDTSDAVKLDEATKDGAITINPVGYVVLAIHNEKSDNVDYNNYLIEDEDGTKYVTGSESFWNSFIDIYTEMKDETEPWQIKAYRLPSKNYNGKEFLTCSII